MKDTLLEFLKKNPAIGLSVLSAIGYFAAYQFEVGQCIKFGIPESFIEVGLTNVLYFVSSLVLFTSILLSVYNHVQEITESIDTQSKMRMYWPLNIILVCFLGLVYYILINKWKFYIIGPLLLIFANLALYQRIKDREKWVAVNTDDILRDKPNLSRKILKEKLKERSVSMESKIVYSNIALFAISLIIIPATISMFGMKQVISQTKYMKMKDHPELIFLKRYGDTYIFRNINKGVLGDQLVSVKHSPQFPLLLTDTTLTLKFIEKD